MCKAERAPSSHVPCDTESSHTWASQESHGHWLTKMGMGLTMVTTHLQPQAQTITLARYQGQPLVIINRDNLYNPYVLALPDLASIHFSDLIDP